MSVPWVCPYCKTEAPRTCAHLALAAAPRDFVRLCIERCHGETLWRKICAQHPAEDFTWLETSFGEQFLKPLAAFGVQAYIWQPPTASAPRELKVLLWAHSPEKLWWDLRDLLEARADRSPGPTRSAGVRCPVCRRDPHEQECEHLVLHGEDLQTEEVIAYYNPKGAWQKLTTSIPDVPADAATFFKRFENRFPSLARVDCHPWLGEALGLGESYAYIWVKDPAAFQNELGEFLRA